MTHGSEEIRGLLGQLDAETDPATRGHDAEALMRAVYRLGLARQKGAVSAEVGDSVSSAFAPVLRRNMGALSSVAGAIEDQLAFGLDSWDQIAWRRSAFEFLRELLSPEDADWLQEQIQPDGYDDLIRQASDKFGYLDASEIPAEMPRSHWWWWAPRQPGDRS